MSSKLRRGDRLAASRIVTATPVEVYAVVADPVRTPEWSPETRRCEWVDETHFRSWNRRRLGRWRTESRVVAAVPGQEFAFVVTVPALGGDWTRWTYRLEPADVPGTTRLTETFEMCVDLPLSVLLFERVLLLVRDRRADLQANLEQSVTRIKHLVEHQPPT